MLKQVSKLGFLEPHKTLFLLCDVQEKFRPAMKYFGPMVVNANKLVKAGKILDVPLIATEQYPEKLGNIVKDIDISHAIGVFPKTQFSMAVPEVTSKIKDLFHGKLENVVLFGIETHICVEQSAMHFLAGGYSVHIPADCCMSRSLQDRAIALNRLRDIGCSVTTSESVIFRLMKDKNHPKFDQVRKLVAEPSDEISPVSMKL